MNGCPIIALKKPETATESINSIRLVDGGRVSFSNSRIAQYNQASPRKIILAASLCNHIETLPAHICYWPRVRLWMSATAT